MTRITLAFASLFVAVTVRGALAQPVAAQAEVLFDRGKKLMADGKTGEACAAFESSQKLDPEITTLLNLADCREKNGQLASAWGHFVEAERQTRGGSGGLRKLNQVATERANKLEPRVSKLTISVPQAVPGLEVTRNGQIVDAGAFNAALPLDGGTFEIAARAPGYQSWSTTVQIAVERDQKVIEIPVLDEPSAAKPGDRAPEKPRDVQPTPERPVTAVPTRGASRAIPIALAVAGGVLAGGAVGFELWGRAKYDDALVEPNDAEQEDLWRAANTRRYTAVGMGIAAAGCVGAAIFMFVRSPARSAESATASRVHVQPVAGGDVTGVLVHASW